MNLALGGYGNKIVEEEYVDERTGKTVPVSTFPMEMRIDWVRHYRPAEPRNPSVRTPRPPGRQE